MWFEEESFITLRKFNSKCCYFSCILSLFCSDDISDGDESESQDGSSQVSDTEYNEDSDGHQSVRSHARYVYITFITSVKVKT